MKKFLLFFTALAACAYTGAQNSARVFPGDTLEIFTVINFEDPAPDVNIPAASGNTWQIGPPQKTFFNAAYSVPNAIVTDTLGYYPANNHSCFDLYVGKFNMGGPFSWYFPDDIFIDFRHKFDTDTLKDGGYIEVSWDKGLTWMNIIEDTVYHWGVTPGMGWENVNLYTTGDTLYNGEHGFSGHSGGWIHSSLTWHVIPVDQLLDFPPDTMILRFNFISDADDHSREGWMIDQIRLFAIDLGSGKEDVVSSAPSFIIAPNPVKDHAVVSFKKKYLTIDFGLYDARGQRVKQASYQNCNSFRIERGNLPAGLYLCKIQADNKKVVFKRLILI